MSPAARSVVWPRHIRLRVLLTLNALAITVLLVATGVIPPPPARSAPPMVLVAHRGDLTRYPENTREGILAATTYSNVAVEFDAWRSASGMWWIIHDEDVSMTTTGSGLISTLDDAYLASLKIDGGAGYVAGRDDGRYRLPRLHETLAALAPTNASIYVHCKPYDPAAASEIAEALVAYGLVGRSAIIVPTSEQGVAVKAVSDKIRVVVIHEHFDPPDWTPSVDAWLTDGRHVPSSGFIEGRPYEVEAYANLRVPVENELHMLERMYRWNAAAFISNDIPAALARLNELTSERH